MYAVRINEQVCPRIDEDKIPLHVRKSTDPVATKFTELTPSGRIKFQATKVGDAWYDTTVPAKEQWKKDHPQKAKEDQAKQEQDQANHEQDVIEVEGGKRTNQNEMDLETAERLLKQLRG